jgi:hypothetical protein
MVKQETNDFFLLFESGIGQKTVKFGKRMNYEINGK